MNCTKCRIKLNEFEEVTGICGYCLATVKSKRRKKK